MPFNEPLSVPLGRVRSVFYVMQPLMINFRLEAAYIEDLTPVPAMDQLELALSHCNLVPAMLDTTKGRYVDVYCTSSPCEPEE